MAVARDADEAPLVQQKAGVGRQRGLVAWMQRVRHCLWSGYVMPLALVRSIQEAESQLVGAGGPPSAAPVAGVGQGT